MARPTLYSEEIAVSICTLLAEGLSLREVCAHDGMPDKSTVIRWLATNSEFCDQYAQAKEVSTFVMAEELLEIADDSSNDYMDRQARDGSVEEVLNPENIQRSRLRVDTRKWLMEKLKPKKYGQKLDIDQKTEHSGGISMTIDQANAILQEHGIDPSGEDTTGSSPADGQGT
ncbi:hypothetical protein QT397_18195 [Microbulbifer sp. MKSA007]|nr:hypothetical protein QT397_18195 [Microbulbifer sp. MKSA007]